MKNLVIGLGQIGLPIMGMLGNVQGLDIETPAEVQSDISAMHICFPWDRWFISSVRGYADRIEPELIVIHSTVAPGATDAIAHRVKAKVVYSPVRGRHGQMDADLKRYTKFVGGDPSAVKMAAGILSAAGFTVKEFPSAHALELAKLLETSYSGLLIAWAQEMSRYCDGAHADYLDVMQFMAEIDYLPRVVFQPGHIGGHCIMPNLDILEQVRELPSPFIGAIRASNERTPDTGERLEPIPTER